MVETLREVTELTDGKTATKYTIKFEDCLNPKKKPAKEYSKDEYDEL